MTNRWHFDITVTQAEDLERNYIRNICFVTRSTHTTDGFWHVFGSMGFLQLEDENSRTEYQLQSRSPEVFRRLKGIRIGNSLNCDYTFSFSMKLSPQQLVYDQDANRSRRFILTLGASLNFIAKCFKQCFLFVDIWTATWSCLRIYLFQKIDYKALHWVRVTFDSVEYTWKVCFTIVSKSSQVYNRLQTSPYIEGCSVHVVIKSQWIVQSLVHTLSCMPISNFPLQDVSVCLPDKSIE